MPFQFLPDHPDQKYFRLGEDPLVGCLRAAVREVCRSRWRHVTLVDGWTEFLEKERFMGQVGKDTNQDGNDVEGLIDYIRAESEHHNQTQHPATNDTKVCSSLVDRFSETFLVDEIILSWAADEGYVSRQLPFQPKVEKRFTSPEASLILAHKMGFDLKNTTDSDNVALFFKWLELLGRLYPGNSTHALANVTIPRNSTHRGNSTRPDDDRDEVFPPMPSFAFPPDWDWPIPPLPTGTPGSATTPRNSTGRGNFTLPEDLWDWLEQLRNSSVRVPGNSTRGLYGHHPPTPTATLNTRGEPTPPVRLPPGMVIIEPLPGRGPMDIDDLRELIEKFFPEWSNRTALNPPVGP